MAKEFRIPPRLVGLFFTAKDVSEILAYEQAERELATELEREEELKQQATEMREKAGK